MKIEKTTVDPPYANGYSDGIYQERQMTTGYLLERADFFTAKGAVEVAVALREEATMIASGKALPQGM